LINIYYDDNKLLWYVNTYNNILYVIDYFWTFVHNLSLTIKIYKLELSITHKQSKHNIIYIIIKILNILKKIIK